MRALGWLAYLALLIGGVFVAGAMAHRAPSGWAYDHECCHDLDCAPVAEAAIREVAGGYQVTILPGTHPMVPAGAAAVTGFVPHGDRRIRPSGDQHRHACVSRAGAILCIYIRAGGV